MYRQYSLKSDQRVTTGWIDTPAALREGTRLTTKEHGPDIVWTVVLTGRVQRADPPDRRWQVGGLH